MFIQFVASLLKAGDEAKIRNLVRGLRAIIAHFEVIITVCKKREFSSSSQMLL